MQRIKACRKCGSSNMTPFLGTNGASFVKCETCGAKRRHGLDAETLKNLLGVQGQAATQTVIQKQSMDPAVLEKIVADVLAARVAEIQAAAVLASKPQVIEVHHEKGKAVKIEGGHYLLGRLIKLVRAGFHVYLWGPAGTGKTTAAIMAADALKRKAEIDTLDPTTFRSMIQGYCTPEGKPVHTAFTRCWEKGMVYVADETDNAPGHVQTLFNSALANGHAPLAWGNVGKQDGFAFIGTGNTPGRATRQFPDRKPMSAAFADRLYFVYWPLDPAIEARAGGLAVPAAREEKVESVTPERWVKFVQGVRQWAADNCPTLMVTPRATLVGLQALKVGESPMQVADALIFRGADDEIRSKALSSVRI